MDIRIPLHLFRRKSRLLAGLVTVLLLVFLSGASFVQNADAQAVIVDFTPSGLGGETVTNPTSLQFGPDGRLYVSVQSGDIYAYDVVRNAANDYDVVGVENITLVKNITNYDDDGTSTNTTNRQITGIYVTGTGVNPILYVTSSDPRIGAGGGGEDKGLDTNSGIVSKLTCTGGMLIDGNTSTCQGWDMVHLVRGLPRSEENHSVNGMQIDEANNIMYLAVGGNTNAGAPSNNFALTTEYVYAAAVVTIDLDAIETNYPIQIDGNGEAYRYDLPTLDDPTRPNVFPDGTPASEDPNDANYSPLDENDPWGGNDGLNQAKIDVGGPVQLYATGFRNLYDIVITEDNRMYGVDNGANQQWGGHPLGEADYPAETTVGLCTHEYDPNEPGSTDTGPGGDSVVNNQNGLHYIRTLEPGDLNYVQPDEMYYGGHPAPIRGNPDGAGLYTKFEERDAQNNIISSTTFWRTQILDSTDPNFETQSLPVDWPPVPLSMAYAAECDFRDSGEDDNSLSNYTDSTNGIAEYTASNFGGALQGYLLLASYNNKIYQVELSSDGKTALNCPARPPLGSTVATCSIGSAEFASNFGSTPLDVIAQGDADPFGGTVWSVTYGANSITVFEPADYDGADPIICTGADDDTIDEDGDGYTNADEIDNDSNPCSGSVKPTDFDQTLDYTAGDTDFLRSDLNDNDDDNDSLLDDVDPFPLDCSNGEGGSCAAIASGFLQIGSGLQFFNETGYGFGTIGLTGLMTNETTDYLNQISNVNNELVFGGTAGIYTDVSVGDTTPVGATNNLVNAWQFSLDTDVNTAPFQIETQMNGPLFNALQGGESAWQGLQLGSGDQDNFIMFVLETDDVGTRFRVYAENNGTEIYNVTETAPAAVLDPGSIRMYLTVNPGTGNVQASYQFVPQSGNIGALTDVGGNVTLQGEALAALQGTHTISGVPSALAVGMVANASQADPAVGASWDFFNVDTVPSSAEALVQASTNGLLGSTFNENSITITNNSSAGETITNVTFDIGGGMIPEIVFDPDGTAGDAVGRGFFPAGGSEVTTGATASFAQPYEGGFYELSIDFTNFDPGEQLVFGVDIDPISVKGGSAPGPGEAASVSGLEMAGSSVSVTYSNGETQVVELYRTQPDANSAAENVVTNAKPIAPSITMDNVSSQSIVFDAVQNVKVAADLEDTVYLLQLETAMFLEGLDGPNAPDGYNVDPWEVNSIVSISEYDATVGNGGVADIPVTLLNTDPEAGFNVFAAVVVRTLENGDIVTSDLSNYIIVKYDPAAAPESAYRVNAGAVTIPATDGGLDWTAVGDGAQSGPGYSVNNGILTGFGADSLDPSVPSYAPLALFDQEKYDPPGGAEMTWNFDVEPDTYIVRLFMANTFSGTSAVGQRIFDIAIEGTTVEQNLDLVAEFGHKVGGVKEYVVENTDGTINIEFLHGSVENPLVNAIEVAPYDIGAETPINVTGIPNQVNVEGEAADFDVAATGGDGGSLSYTAVGLPPGIGLEPTNGDIIGTIDFGAAANSPYTVTITVDDNDFTSVDAVSVSFQWTVSDGSQPAQAVLYRVNAGGPSIAAPDGSLPAWSADTDTANSPFLSEPGSNNTFIAGDPITFDTSIPASAPEAMLQASRFDFAGGNEMAYSFPVDVDTEVEIRLYFAETFLNQNDGNPGTDGSRIFDIAVDGTVPAVFNDIDQEASFGHDVGFMLSFQTVSDGAVDLEFLRFAENPSIKGIEILKTIPTVDNTLPVLNFPSMNGLTNAFEGQPLEIPITATDADNEPITLSAFIDYDPLDDGNRLPAPFDYNLVDNGDGTGTLFAYPKLGDADGAGPQFYTAAITAADTRDSVTEVTFIGVQPAQLGNDITIDGTDLPPVAPGELLQTVLTVNGPTSGNPVSVKSVELVGDNAVNFTISGTSPALPVDLPVGETMNINLEFQAAVEGAYDADLQVFYADGANIARYTVASLTGVASDAANPDPLVCVNAGGVPLNAFGRTFQGDTGASAYFTNGTTFGNEATDGTVDITNLDGTDVIGSAEDLFQTERYGGSTTTMTFALDSSNMPGNTPIPNGDYTLDIYYAEIFVGVQGSGAALGAGARVFDVTAQGGTVQVSNDLDIFTIPDPDAPLKAITITSPTVEVTDGTLTVEFDATEDNAKVSAICLVPGTGDNLPPVFYPVQDMTYGVLAEFGTGDTIDRLVVDAFDLEGNNITYGATGLPTGLTMNTSTGEVTGIIDENAFTGGPFSDGVYPVTVTATDDGIPSEQDSITFNMTVVNREVQILAPLDGASIPKDTELTVSWTSTGGETDPGYFDHVHVYFYPAGIPDTLKLGSQPLNGTVNITDETGGDEIPDNNDGFWAAYFDEDGILIPGDYTIEIRHAYPTHVEYTNGLGEYYFSTATFTITDDLANDPPMVTNPGEQANVEGETVSLQIQATPPENDQTLTYSAQNLPPSLTIDENTGVISGTLDEGSSDSAVEGAFIEENGIVVIEMESAPETPGDWKIGPSGDITSANIDDEGQATGGQYLVWEGTQFFDTPGNGTITYPIQINTPGTYQFNWRTQVGIGTNTTEHNDTWLKIEADSFFGEQGGGSIVCPIGLNPADNACVGGDPEGAGGGGWFKIFSSGAQTWTWGAATSDFDSHQIFATFDEAGFYNIQISARSSGHVIDRMVLYKTDFSGNPLDTGLAESNQTGPVTPIPGAAGQYNVTVTATDDATPPVGSSVMFIWNVFPPDGIPGAKVTVNAGGALGASSFGNNSFQISNIGEADISTVTIDTRTAYLPDVVFDPLGTAGDPQPKCLTEGSASVGDVGITVPANGGTDNEDCASVHTLFHNGVDSADGYDNIVLNFTDFNPGEVFAFGIDLDPTTIKGGVDTGEAGLISGFELIGSTVTIEFEDGTTLTGTLGDEGSLGGSEAVLIPVVPAAPTNIELAGFPTTPTVTSVASQTLNITGTPNTTVEVVQVDARLFIDPANPNVGYDIDPFEANEAVSKVVSTVTLDGSGNGSLPVTLLRAIGTAGDPDAGLNHFVAYTVQDSGGETVRSLASNVIVIEYDPNFTTPSLEFAEESAGSIDFELIEGETGSASFTLLTDNGLPFTGTAPIGTTEAWATTVSAAAYNTGYTLNVDTAGLAPGNYQATLNAGAIPGFTATSVPINLLVKPIPTATEVCINAGGPEITENGLTFLAADQPDAVTNFVGTNYSFTSAGEYVKPGAAPAINVTDASLEGAYTDAIFNTERFGDPMTWDIPVLNGDYEVQLFFAELFVGVAEGSGGGLGNGARVFSVSVDGNTSPELTNIDLFADSGALYGVMIPINTTVDDNEVNLVFDATSDNAKVNAICVIPQNEPPVITLNGDNPQTVEGDLTVNNYVEAGATATDTEDGDISGDIVIDDSALDTTTVGSYDVTYTVTDSGGTTVVETRTVDVVDTTAPVITIPGDNPLQVAQGSTYTPPAVTALDNIDGDLTGSLVVGGDTVDTATVGTYNVTYDVTDAAGNAATQATLVVEVTPAPDTEAPVITIDGANPLEIAVGATYTQPTVTATDNFDGDISGDIVVGGDTVDTATPGTYNVTFDVADAAGNDAVQQILVVNVVDLEAPVITLTGDASVDINLGDDFSTTDPGATALDNVDGDISGNIVVDYAAIDPDTVGSYEVTYNVADAAGNDAVEVIRTVNVLGAPAGVDIVAQTASTTVGLGDTFTVDVVVQTTQDVDSAEIRLEFDQTLLQVVSLTSGSTLDTVLQTTFDNVAGTVDYDAGTINDPKPTADFTLVTIEFQTLGATTGTDLTFTNNGGQSTDVLFAGGSVLNTATGLTMEVTTTATINGTVAFQGRPAAPDPSYARELTVTLYPIGGAPALPDVVVNSNESGEFVVSNVPVGTYNIAVNAETTLVSMLEGIDLAAGDVTALDFGELSEGDANGDNQVTLPDFSILSASYGLREGDTGYIPGADFTGDDYVSLRDFALLIENYGMEGEAPAD